MASSSTSLTSFETALAEFIRARGGNVSGTEQYPYPSHVNAASFVAIKLSSEANYGVWQEQMMCLVESHGMLGFINGTLKEHEIFEKEGESTLEARYGGWKRSDTLVKGWIFGSLSENVMRSVVGLHTANDVWEKLRTTYGTPPAPATTTASSSTITTDITAMEKDIADYLPLYRAIKRSDWKKAQEIINRDKDALTAKLNQFGDTTLHIATENEESIHLYENLLKEITPESLPTMVRIDRSNPLHTAAMLDNTIAAKMLVEKNPHLLFILNDNFLPINIAVLNAHERTFLYLLDVCKKHIVLCQQDGYHSPFEGKNGACLLTSAIDSGFFDASIQLINDYPDMARTKSIHDNASLVPLNSISRKWDSYHSGTRYNFYQRSVYAYVPIGKNRLHDTNKMQDIENQGTYKAKFLTKSMKSCFYYVFERIYVKFWKVALLQVPHIKRLQEEKIEHQAALLLLKSICEEVAKINLMSAIDGHYLEAFITAVYNDTPEVIKQIIECFPMAYSVGIDGYNIVQIAIRNRCEKIYNYLVCHLSYDKYLQIKFVDKESNNLLHLTARLAPIHKLNRDSGAALQMRRELQWFEEVRNFVKPLKYMDAKNNEQETPITVFSKEHKQLRKEGEEWMKKTADSYTIVAALIITIVFAAAITVPGGNNSDTGKAIYGTRTSFIVFAFADAISLFSSTTSLLLFLSILTTRFREEDFLYRLPKRLILGLAMLFLSVTSMMVAFSATLYLMFGHGRGWIVIPIATLTCLPIASFVTLQLPLLVDLISSTYGRGIFAKRSDHKLKQL